MKMEGRKKIWEEGSNEGKEGKREGGMDGIRERGRGNPRYGVRARYCPQF